MVTDEENNISVASGTFDHILNFRDVGAKMNGYSGSKIMRERRLYRSARPDDASAEDRRKLLQDYGIRTIIDLRTRSERIKQAKKRDADIRSAAILPQSDDAALDPLKIPGIQYCEVNLNGGAFERALLWKLSWSSLARLFALMAWGRRLEAISILGREVMQPRGLVGLGMDSIDHCWAELKEVFQILADSHQYPVMIHCTQGKDRTGLIVLLLLLMLDIPVNAVTHDYLLSEAKLRSEKEARMHEIRELGLTEEFAGTPPDFVLQINQHIDDEYGGLLPYLRCIGVSVEMQEKMKSICMA